MCVSLCVDVCELSECREQYKLPLWRVTFGACASAKTCAVIPMQKFPLPLLFSRKTIDRFLSVGFFSVEVCHNFVFHFNDFYTFNSFYVFEASLYKLLLYQLWVKAIVLVHLSRLLPIQRHRCNILIFNPISNNKEII